MKITHPTEHDEIVKWITLNPEKFIESIGIKDSYENITYERIFPVYDKNKHVGDFDIMLRLNKDKSTSFDIVLEDGNLTESNSKVFIKVNVQMESAMGQLGELKKIINQHMNNTSRFNKKYYFVIVSQNDTNKLFFTDEKIIFYKF